MMVIGHKQDTAEYPAVAPYIDRRALEVRLLELSIDGLQSLLTTIYSVHAANPAYLFVAECDYCDLVDSAGGLVTHLINRATGRCVYVVPLPALRTGTVLTGFF